VDSAASDTGLGSEDEVDKARKLDMEAVESGVSTMVVASDAAVEGGEAAAVEGDEDEKEKADDE